MADDEEEREGERSSMNAQNWRRKRTGLFTADRDEGMDAASGTAAYARAPRQYGGGDD